MKGRVLGIDHLGIALRDPRARLPLWADALGLTLEHVEAVPAEGVRVWFLNFGSSGGSRIELVEPTDSAGTVAQAIDKRGEGIHHLCLRVDDLEAVLARLAAQGMMPVGGVRIGAHDRPVAFIHPKSTGGVLLELSQWEQPPDIGSSAVLASGAIVIAYLREPRERLLGRLLQLDAAGVMLEAIDLDSWESWLAQWSHDEPGPIRPSRQFVPMLRVDKLVADDDTPEIPSLTRQFKNRTGRELARAFAPEGGR